MVISIDIETRSGHNIADGVYKYITHPDFKVLIASLDVDGKKVRLDFTKEPIPEWYRDLMMNPNVEKWAYNAQFERICISKQLGLDNPMSPKGWYCKMVHCYGNGASGTLAGAEKLFNDKVVKDPVGKQLIKLFSIPPYAVTEGELWDQFKDYCDKDVVAEMQLAPEYNSFDKELYDIDQEINDRGIGVDLTLVKRILAAVKEMQEKAKKRTVELGLDNANSVPQKMIWFANHRVSLPNVQKQTLNDIKTDDPEVTEMLELLETLGSATVKKYQKILDMAVNGRVYGMFSMMKQHCFRWSGNGVQVHNLNRGYSTEEEINEAMKNIDSIHKAKNLVRACFVGNFQVADFSGIEARVLAWIAGDTQKVGLIKSGIDLYKKNASDLFDVPYSEVTKNQRSVGKIMELALGYQGWIGAMHQFGADKLMTEPEIKTSIEVWRLHNSKIVNFWKQVEQTAHLCIMHKTAIRVNEHIYIEYNGKDMLIALPSGHKIVYKNVKLSHFNNKTQISYQVNNGNLVDTRYTWGGKLTENIVQAIAWSLLRHSIIKVSKKYDIVAHVHDEIIIENGDLPGLLELMTNKPEWAAGLPLEADGWEGTRYRKG